MRPKERSGAGADTKEVSADTKEGFREELTCELYFEQR